MNTCCPESLVESTPSGINVEEMFGYTTGANNFPGVLALVFKHKTSIAGFAIANQLSLLSLAFPNLTAIVGTDENSQLTVGSNPVLTSVSVPVLTTLKRFSITNNAVLPSLIFPALTSITGTGTVTVGPNAALASLSFPVLVNSGAALSFLGNPVLTALSLPTLVTVGRGLGIGGCVALTTLSLPAVTSIAVTSGSLSAAGCTALANVSFPNYLPVNGRNQTFSACALTQASVDHILARCVASATYVTGTVDTSGGTSATPGVQGILDKATLIARGVTVLTN